MFYEVSATSADGLNWVNQQWPLEHSPSGMAYGKGQFVAVGGSYSEALGGGGCGTVQTSKDGLNWVSPRCMAARPLRGIAFGNSHFVAVGDGGAILQSGDIAPLQIKLSIEGGLRSLSLSGSAGLNYTVQTSTDLISWRNQTNITTAQDGTARLVALAALPAASDHLFYRAYSQ
jgi:hypothetical protein